MARRELDRFLERCSVEEPVSIQLGEMLAKATGIA